MVTAAIISSIVIKLMGNKGTQATIGKLIAGLYLAFTIVSPLRDIRMSNLSTMVPPYAAAAEDAAQQGASQTQRAMADRIKHSCEAYILDKAQQLSADLEVSVTLSDDEIPVPSAAELKGKVSPNTKKKLEGIIAEDLGIPKEAQKWS